MARHNKFVEIEQDEEKTKPRSVNRVPSTTLQYTEEQSPYDEGFKPQIN